MLAIIVQAGAMAMNPRDPRIDTFIERIRNLMRGKYQDEWAADVANALEDWEQDIDAIAALCVRLQIENRSLSGSIWIARELVAPKLEAKIAIEQYKAAQSFGRSATRLAVAAVVFGAIQALCAAVSLYILFRSPITFVQFPASGSFARIRELLVLTALSGVVGLLSDCAQFLEPGTNALADFAACARVPGVDSETARHRPVYWIKRPNSGKTPVS